MKAIALKFNIFLFVPPQLFTRAPEVNECGGVEYEVKQSEVSEILLFFDIKI